MNSEWLNSAVKNIEVPTEEIFSSIEKGIAQGQKQAKQKSKTSFMKKAPLLSAAAAALILASGFVYSPMANALTNIPLIGSIYENYQMDIGQNLVEQNLISPYNETVINGDVALTITSTFFDGQYIGITFQAEGSGLTEQITDAGPESGYSYTLFNNTNDTDGWSSTMGGLEKVDTRYSAGMILEAPAAFDGKEVTIPITFNSIGGVQGEWHFDIPVEQLPTTTIQVDQSTSSSDELYTADIESLVLGNSSAVLNYTNHTASQLESYTFSLEVYDADNKKVALNSLGNDQAIIELGQSSDTNFLKIIPTWSNSNEIIKLEPVQVNLGE